MKLTQITSLASSPLTQYPVRVDISILLDRFLDKATIGSFWSTESVIQMPPYIVLLYIRPLQH